MKRILWMTGFLAAIFSVLGPELVVAQTQRMALAAGSYSIEAGATSRVPSYCLDYTRKAPGPKSNFKHVLSAPSEASITVGDQTFTMQEAIDKNLVEVRGNLMSIEDLMASLDDPVLQQRMTVEQRVQSATLQRYWRAASETERDAMQAGLDNSIAMEATSSVLADYRHLSIHNLTSQPMKLETSGHAQLGVEPEISVSLNTGEDQSVIWLRTSRQHQEKLQAVGYEIQVDGVVGPGTTGAIESFQTDRRLPRSGILDVETLRELEQASKDVQLETERIGRINQELSSTCLLSVRYVTQGKRPVYTVFSAPGSPVYQGSRVSNLLDAVRQEAHRLGRETAYLDLGGLGEVDRIKKFAYSIEVQQAGREADVRISSLGEHPASLDDQVVLFSKVGEISRVSTTDPQLLTTGERSGFYTGSANYWTHAKQFTLDVFSRSREATKSFLSRFSKNLSDNKSLKRSLIEELGALRKDVGREYNLTPKELILEFKGQFSTVNVVMVEFERDDVS